MNKSKYKSIHLSSKIKKSFVITLLVLCLLSFLFSGSGIGQSNPSSMVEVIVPYPSTDRAVYLLDPYEWVYNDTENHAGCYPNGHGQDVILDVMLLDQNGHLVSGAEITYSVANSTGVSITGSATETLRPGFYQDIFVVNEDFVRNEPNISVVEATISLTATYDSVIGKSSYNFNVNRWGCDDCHTPNVPDAFHTGWKDVLGSLADGSVTYDNLKDSELTHTPISGRGMGKLISNHETTMYFPLESCTICHVNSTECTDCHTGYLLGQHTNVVPGTVYDGSDPSTSCVNSSCHGHINDDAEGEIDNRYPDCSDPDCHPISYLDGTITPGWFRDANTIRNPAIHPGGSDLDEIVNCSFCHYSFHNIQDEQWTMENRNCQSCHKDAESFTNHSYTNVTCAGCHQFSQNPDKWYEWYGSIIDIDYHNINIPKCNDCHASDEYKIHPPLNESEIQAEIPVANCTHCHNNLTLYYDGSVFPVGTYNTNSKIHTTIREQMLPNQTSDMNDSCAICHITVLNKTPREHSGGSNCENCHGNPHNIGPGGGPNCTDCHLEGGILTGGFDSTFPILSKSGFISSSHRNVTGDFNADNYSQLSKVCWGCHVDYANPDHSRPAEELPECEDCHFNETPLNGAYLNRTPPIQIPEHQPLGIEVQTGANCTLCHNNSLSIPIPSQNIKYDEPKNYVSHYLTTTYLMTPTNDTTDCVWCHILNSNNASWGYPINPMNPGPTRFNHSGLGISSTNNDACYPCHVLKEGYDDTGKLSPLFNFHNISMAPGGGKDCTECHDIGGTAGINASINITAMNLSDAAHYALNSGASTLLDSNNERCWACHGDGDGSEEAQPEGHPINYNNPKNCSEGDCHGLNTSIFGESTAHEGSNFTDCEACHVDPHYLNLAELSNCTDCHLEGGNLTSGLDPTTFPILNKSEFTSSQHRNVTGDFNADNYSQLSRVCWGCHVDYENPGHSRPAEELPACVGCHNNDTPLNELYLNKTSDNLTAHEDSNFTNCDACHFDPHYLNLAELSNCTDCHLEGGNLTSGLDPTTFPILNKSEFTSSQHRNVTGDFNADNYSQLSRVCWGCHVDYENPGHSRPAEELPACVGCHNNDTPLNELYLNKTSDNLTAHEDSNFTNCELCHVNPHYLNLAEGLSNCTDCHLEGGNLTSGLDPTTFPILNKSEFTSSLHRNVTGDFNADNYSQLSRVCWGCHVDYENPGHSRPAEELPACVGCHNNDTPLNELYLNKTSDNLTAHEDSNFTDCEACHVNPHYLNLAELSNCTDCHLEGGNLTGGLGSTFPILSKSGFISSSHRNVTGDFNVEDYSQLSRVCWGCHVDYEKPGHSRPAEELPACEVCHFNETPLNELYLNKTLPIQIPEHQPLGIEVQTTTANCTSCHNNSLSILIPTQNIKYNESKNYVSHYLTTTYLMTPTNDTTDCVWCHILNTNNESWGYPINPMNPDPTRYNHSGLNITGTNNSECYPCHVSKDGFDNGELSSLFNFHTISMAPGGGKNCAECHDLDGGAGENYTIDIEAMNLSDAIHYGLNSGASTTLGYSNNERCWACHGDGDGSEGAQPDGHPVNYNNPKKCSDRECHNVNQSLFNEPMVYEHFKYVDEIDQNLTTSADCEVCHLNSVLFHKDKFIPNDTSLVSHYGSVDELINTTSCVYCHLDEDNAEKWGDAPDPTDNVSVFSDKDINETLYVGDVLNLGNRYVLEFVDVADNGDTARLKLYLGETLLEDIVVTTDENYTYEADIIDDGSEYTEIVLELNFTAVFRGENIGLVKVDAKPWKRIHPENSDPTCWACHMDNYTIDRTKYLVVAEDTDEDKDYIYYLEKLLDYSDDDTQDKSTFSTRNVALVEGYNQTLNIAGEYILTAKDIDVEGNKVHLILTNKDGEVLEEDVYRVGDYLEYDEDLSYNSIDIYDFVLFTAKVDSLFQGHDISIAILTDIKAYSDEIVEIEDNETIGGYNTTFLHVNDTFYVGGIPDNFHVPPLNEGIDGSSDCVYCHDSSKEFGIAEVNAIVSQLGGHSGLNVNAAIKPDSGIDINKACWACHGTGEDPGRHPVDYLYPRQCEDCHVALEEPTFNAVDLSEESHGQVGDCNRCHAADYPGLHVINVFEPLTPYITRINLAPDIVMSSDLMKVDITAMAGWKMKVESIEYFIDTDGPYGSGMKVMAKDGAFDEQVEDAQFTIDISGLEFGNHTLYVHSMERGNWGTMNTAVFSVVPDIIEYMRESLTSTGSMESSENTEFAETSDISPEDDENGTGGALLYTIIIAGIISTVFIFMRRYKNIR